METLTVSPGNNLHGANALSWECELPQYSVLMAVYKNDRPIFFEEAIESMAAQTWQPCEIVIIEDGAITRELHDVEERCARKYPGLIRIFALSQNSGLGIALRHGIVECQCEWIARMDSDDISEPNRCELELRAALQNGADIVGCDCEEFVEDIHLPASRRLFPETHRDLVRFSKGRVPFCHPAVMMKKSAVLFAGNYDNVYLHEDYDLFVRMLAGGAIGYTVKKTLFHVRVGKDFYMRRGGLRYIRELLASNVWLLKSGWMSPYYFIIRSCANIVLGLSPVTVRTWLYRRLLRG